MAFSLEELMGYFFNNSGGGGVWYGGTGISYGPIANGIPTGGSEPSYPDDEGDDGGGGPGGGSNPSGEVRSLAELKSADVNDDDLYVDKNGNYYMMSDDGQVFRVGGINPQTVIDRFALQNGEFETITTDTGTFYLHNNGNVYIRSWRTGDFYLAAPGAPDMWSSPINDVLIVDDFVAPDGGAAGPETLWETLRINDKTYWISHEDGKIYSGRPPVLQPSPGTPDTPDSGAPTEVFLNDILQFYDRQENGNIKDLNQPTHRWAFFIADRPAPLPDTQPDTPAPLPDYQPDTPAPLPDYQPDTPAPAPDHQPDTDEDTQPQPNPDGETDPENDVAAANVIRKGYTVFDTYAVRTIYGTAGNDVIDEGGWVLGGQGNDVITGNAFSDTLIGGDGSDSLDGAAGDDTIDGGADADVISGGDGNDLLDGNAGNDFLSGGMGADTFVGGDGWDQVNYTDSQTGVVVDLENVSTGGGAEGDRFNGIEAVAGSAYGDQLLGNSQNNNLIGGDGDDYMDGRAGIDWLFGESGDDTLAGGLGGDFLIGGAGVDTADYRNALEAVIVNLATGGTGGEADGDQFFDIENLSGSNFDDQLTGDAGANALSGNGGADLLDGGDGNDTLDGGSGFDLADYSTERAGLSLDLTGGSSGDVLSSIEGLVGTAYDDVLTGNAGANFLDGGFGNDVLRGGAGSDTLSGGRGSDVFEFGSQVGLDQDVDWIMDFDIGEDRIQLDSSIFAGLRAGRLDQAAFALKIATTADHRIVYDAESGALFYDADGTGRIEQVKFAVLTPGTALNADHFLIV